MRRKRFDIIFQRYLELKSVFGLMEVLRSERVVSKVRTSEAGRQSGGVPFNRGALYHLLKNRVYLGEITHKDVSYQGLHDAIVSKELWDSVQALLSENRVERQSGRRTKKPSLLSGLIFDDHGVRMTPSHAVKSGKRYRYYVSKHLTTKANSTSQPGRRTPAGEVERLVSDHIREFIRDERNVWSAVQARTHDPERQDRYRTSVKNVQAEWAELEPSHIRRMLLSLIVRIDLNPKTVDIQLRPNAIAYLKLDDFQPCPDIEGPTKSLSIPARLKRAGMEKRMIVDGPSTSGKKRKPDRSLIRLILTGQRYQDRIVKAEGKSIQQLCDEEGVTRSYFTRALRLAYLAPDMIKLILAGSQPADMKASTLKRASRLPLDWAEQRSLFGIS